MSKHKWTHEELLREVASGLVRAGLINYAKTCQEAADYIAELEKRDVGSNPTEGTL